MSTIQKQTTLSVVSSQQSTISNSIQQTNISTIAQKPRHFSKRFEAYSRTMPFSSRDPCGGLDPDNFDAVKKKLMRQKICHNEYEH